MQTNPNTHNIYARTADGQFLHLGWARVKQDKNGFDYLAIDLKELPRTTRLQAHLTKTEKDKVLAYIADEMAAEKKAA